MSISLWNKCAGILNSSSRSLINLRQQTRGVAQIPIWEYHIRVSPIDGRKRPSQDVLDRFKRLNNGMWIRAHPGRHKKVYQRPEWWREKVQQHYACTSSETQMLHRMVNNFWLRPKYYADDTYEPYNVRHGLRTPRVDEQGQLLRERKKILVDDTTADQYFYDR